MSTISTCSISEVVGSLHREKLRISVLGFSQGGATVNRWLTRGNSKADRMIMWGSLLASDADLNEAAEFFRNTELTIVYGTRDQFGNPEIVADYEKLLKEKGIPYSLVNFDGGHRMDRETLRSSSAILVRRTLLPRSSERVLPGSRGSVSDLTVVDAAGSWSVFLGNYGRGE